MSGCGKLVLPLLSVAVALPLLAQAGPNETAVSLNTWQTGKVNVCNEPSDGSGQQYICGDDESERRGEGPSERGQPCVSFSSDIQPIFDNRCITCHNPDRFLGSLDLTEGNSYGNLVNTPTSDTCMMTVPDSVRVVPCDPAASMLWRKTLPDDSRCGRPMPFGTDGLGVIAPDEFALIEQWIAQGAQNN